MSNPIEIANRIAGIINSREDRQQKLQRVCGQISADLKADVVSVFYRQQDGCLLVAGHGAKPEQIGILFVEKGIGLVNHIVKTSRVLCLREATSHPSFFYIKGIGEEKLHGYIGTPIFRRSLIVGALIVQFYEEHEASVEEIALLETIAQQIADLVGMRKKKKAAEFKVKTKIEGRGVSPGIYFGPTSKRLLIEETLITLSENPGQGYETEKKRFDAARDQSVAFLTELKQKAESQEVRDILASHVAMLDDSILLKKIDEHLKENSPAEKAVTLAVREIARAFERISDPYIRQRSLDVMDIGRRLYHTLSQPEEWKNKESEKGSAVHIVSHLPPSSLIEGGSERFGALIMVDESIYSHSIILAKTLSIPTVIVSSEQVPALLDAERLLVDGEMGSVLINPSDILVENYKKSHAYYPEQKARELGPCRTRDGQQVNLGINIAFARECEKIPKWIPEVGLFRTEFEYFLSSRIPTEEEQLTSYRGMFVAMGKRPINMRILDIGGDKSPPSMHFMHEANPVLGYRSIRYLFKNSDIFFPQLRAMLRAQHETGGNLRIIIPMVTIYEEVSRVRDHLAKAARDLRKEDIVVKMPPLGVMIEVPSSINLIPKLTGLVDFFSVGTNDLIQYYMASDRTNSLVSHLCRWQHPPILATFADIFERCRNAGKNVTVCGEMAGELWGSLVLVGLGYRNLSMDRKFFVRHHDVLSRCHSGELTRLSRSLMESDTSVEVIEKMQICLDGWRDLPEEHREVLQSELSRMMSPV